MLPRDKSTTTQVPLSPNWIRSRLAISFAGSLTLCLIAHYLADGQSSPSPAPVAVVRHAPAINGRVEGSLQLLSGESVTLNSGAVITGDLLVPGTATLRRNGTSNFGGTVEGTGGTTPSGYSVTLNSNVTLGHLVTRTDPVQVRSVPVPPLPAGTRDVSVTSAGQSLGDFNTLRNLTLNSTSGSFVIPPGTYGRFIANSQSTLVFGIAGTSETAVYNLQELTLNSNGRLQVLGPVVINVADRVTVNGGVVLGGSINANWVQLNVARYDVTINSAGALYGAVLAPAGTVTINGRLEGSAICNRLTVNSGGVLKAGTSNRPPGVDAGPDQTITLPAKAVLNGTANDDGLPAGNTVNAIWSMVSGPGTVNFATPTAPATTAAFTVPGSYVLRLTANDGQLGASDDVTITANAPPVNQPPQVNAGPKQTITLPASASLSGTVVDDGLPLGGVLTVAWSQVSGTGSVVFSAPASLSSAVSFSIAGPYVLRLTASDGQLSNSSDVTITVNPANQAPVVNAGPDQSLELGANLLLNPGNETPLVDGQITGWTVVRGNGWTQAAPGSIPKSVEGSTYFLPGNDASAELCQDVNVSAWATRIAHEKQLFNFAAWVRTMPEDPPDKAQVIWEFRDTTNQIVLATFDSGPISSTHGWQLVQWTQQAPAGTGWIRVRLVATRQSGSSNDAFFDGLSLQALDAAGTSLGGSTSDDGLPSGATLASTWTKESGPGDVTFANSQESATTATFSTAGAYILRLSSTDTVLTSDDDVTITVSSANQPPQVDAGADQSVALPGTAALGGTFSDDGLPAGATLNFTWSKVSGPGEVSFGDDHTAATTAAFSAPGTYLLCLTASDTQFSVSDEVSVSVNPANQAPTVNAGTDQTISLPASVALSGAAADDGLPLGGSLTFSWSQLNGPGSITFSSPASLETTAVFSTAGLYVLQLTASDGQLSNSSSVTITVNPANLAPIVNIEAVAPVRLPDGVMLKANVSDDGLPVGGGLSLNWSQLSGPGMVTLSTPQIEWKSPREGHSATSATFSAPGTYQLQLLVSDSELAGWGTVTVEVQAANQPPTVALAAPANGAIFVEPATITLSATVSDDDGSISKLEFIHDGIKLGEVAAPPYEYVWKNVAAGNYTLVARATDDLGAETVSPAITITVNSAGPSLPPDPVTVAPPLDRTVPTTMFAATGFLYTGSNPIQAGVAPGTIQSLRVAVLRGKVNGRDGSPISGVTVTLLNHQELGHTLTRADGTFDLAVNGGGVLAVNYEKDGMLSVQRQIMTPWQNYAWLPEVVMIPLDGLVTPIQMNSNTPMQVARGSLVSDSNGYRQATLLVPGGTAATMVMSSGATQNLSSLQVRVTEYTVGNRGPETMPGDLPRQTAYTYAVEYTADEALAAGAASVQFSQPVIHYMENFLGVKPGQTVPAGTFDRQQGAWVPASNGLVVQILSVVEGQAVLDLDGSGQAALPDAYAARGITGAERQQVATLYEPGQSLWRVPVSHFSPWDLNFGYPISPGQLPNQPKTQSKDQQQEKPDCRTGSIVECQNQVLGEELPILGTPFNLHYRSDQVTGRRVAYQLDIPLTGATLPQGLQQVRLVVAVAGQEFRWEFAPAPNLRHTFTWNGRDAYDRPLNGSQRTRVSIGYVYVPDYTDSYRFALPTGFRLVGIGGGGGGPAILVRGPITAWQDYETTLGLLEAKPLGLGGWRLSHHHVYDPIARMLLEGNGQRRGTQSVAEIISTVAGGGTNLSWPGVSGGVPGQTANFSPKYLAAVPEGSVYASDGNLLARLDPNGTLTRVPGFNGEIRGLASDELGRLYIASSSQVRRLDPNATLTVVAGIGGSPGFGGDNGPATSAQINSSGGLALAPDGTLYIVGGSRIRKVSPGGIIQTISGNGVAAYSGDNGSALSARVNSPALPTLASDGSLYFTDYNPAGYGSFQIRRITPGGVISTVATTNIVDAMAASTDGSLTFSEFNLVFTINGYLNYSGLSRLMTDGTRQTVVPWQAYINPNTGQTLPINDGASPGRAVVYRVEGLTIAPGGDVYLSHTGRIRRIRPSMPELRPGENLIASQDGTEVFVFDGSGRHLRTLDALTGGLHYRFDYDSAGHLISITDGDNNVTTIQRAGPVPQAIVGPFGETTNLGVDGSGYLGAVTNPASEMVSLNYYADGLLAIMTDARQHAYQFQFDADGRLIRDEDPSGGFLSLSRGEPVGQYQISLTTPLSNPTTYQVESLPTGGWRRTDTLPDGTRLVRTFSIYGTESATSPDGTTTSLVEQPDPRWGMQAPLVNSLVTTTPGGLSATLTGTSTASLSQLSDPLSLTAQTSTLTINGRTYTSVYTAANQTFSNSSPMGRQSTSTLDLLGRVVRSQPAALEPLNLAYDSHGRLQTVSQGTGSAARTTSFGYTGNGWLESITDPLSRMARFEYDQAGRVTVQTLPDGREIRYSYDANGNITSITPPGKPQHRFNYTEVDLMNVYDPPLAANTGTRVTSYSYDAERKPIQVIRPDGQTIDFGYDPAARLSALNLPDRRLTFGYSPATGNLTNIIDSAGSSLSYTYDGALPKSTTWSGPVTGTVSRSYDNNFRVTSRSINGGNTINYGYDNDSLLTSAGSMTLARNPQNGLLTGTTLGSVSDSWGYNNFGEALSYTSSASGMPVYSATYTRDNLGRIATKTETLGGAMDTYAYGYDTAGRLETVSKNGSFISTYSYDANGNRLSAQRTTNPEPLTTYAYDDQDRLLALTSATDSCSFTYTANGELQTKTCGTQTTSYNYDVLGNLRRVILPDGTQIDYVIDGQNRRIGKKVNGVLVQGWIYGSQLQPVAEMDRNNSLISIFVYGSKANVPDYMVRGGVTYRIVSDHLGSPRLVINSTTGAIVERIDYDEFGNVISDTSPGFQPFGFAGGMFDLQTKLVRFGARDYDPETGRWTSKDPISFAGGDANLYGYTFSDPVNFVDPSGNDIWDMLGDVSDFSNGFADIVTSGGGLTKLFGLPSLTMYLNRRLGNIVDSCSGFFTAGQWAGTAWSTLIGPASTLNAGARSVFYSGEGMLRAARLGKGAGMLLEDTLGGRWLTALASRSRLNLPQIVWDAASAFYSFNTKGTATVFLGGTGGRTWNSIESVILNLIGRGILPK